MNKIKTWIKNESQNGSLLPICHTANWDIFEKILESGALEVKFSIFPDPEFKNMTQENIVYLFYGIPFYKVKSGGDDKINTDLTDDLPIGLIFRPDLVRSLDRFYPFDTGALFKNKYNFEIKSAEELKLYEIEIDDDLGIKKTINRYYGNNENYCFGRVKPGIKPMHAKEEKLLKLFKHNANSEVDIRRRAFEMHSVSDISLNGYLHAIILPRLRCSDYEYFVKNIKKKHPSIEIEYYNDLTIYNSESARTSLINSTMEYYNKNSSIDFSYGRLN